MQIQGATWGVTAGQDMISCSSLMAISLLTRSLLIEQQVFSPL